MKQGIQVKKFTTALQDVKIDSTQTYQFQSVANQIDLQSERHAVQEVPVVVEEISM